VPSIAGNTLGNLHFELDFSCEDADQQKIIHQDDYADHQRYTFNGRVI